MSKRSGSLKEENSEVVEARALLSSNLFTIKRELSKLERISAADSNYPLAPEHMSALVQYAKTLVAVDKNKKEHPDDDESDDLKNLSDAELAALAKELILGKQKK